MLSVCFRLSVTRVYCDKTTAFKIMQFSLTFWLPTLMTKFEGGPLIWGITVRFGFCHSLSSVCRLFVTWVYYDKTAEARIMQFSLKCIPMAYLFACQVWLWNSNGSLSSGDSNWGGSVSDFAMLYLGNGAREKTVSENIFMYFCSMRHRFGKATPWQRVRVCVHRTLIRFIENP